MFSRRVHHWPHQRSKGKRCLFPNSCQSVPLSINLSLPSPLSQRTTLCSLAGWTLTNPWRWGLNRKRRGLQMKRRSQRPNQLLKWNPKQNHRTWSYCECVSACLSPVSGSTIDFCYTCHHCICPIMVSVRAQAVPLRPSLF